MDRSQKGKRLAVLTARSPADMAKVDSGLTVSSPEDRARADSSPAESRKAA